MDTRDKVLIGLTAGGSGTFKAKTTLALMNIVKQAKSYDVIPALQFGPFIADNRNDLVKFSQKLNCSHLFFVDADMHFDPQTLNILLEHNKDIVGVNYNMRGLINNLPVSVVKLDEKEMPKELFKCNGVGTGLMLIKTSVFDKVSFPWFKFEYGDSGRIELGEDYYFCKKAKEAGFDVWCDPIITVSHIGDWYY